MESLTEILTKVYRVTNSSIGHTPRHYLSVRKCCVNHLIRFNFFFLIIQQ